MYSSYKIHLVKVITTVPINIDTNLKLICNAGSLYSSIYKPTVNKQATKVASYIDELKEILKKRNLKKEEQEKQEKKLKLKKKLDEENKKWNKEMQEILEGIIAEEKLNVPISNKEFKKNNLVENNINYKENLNFNS